MSEAVDHREDKVSYVILFVNFFEAHNNSAYRDPQPHMPSITSENMHHTDGSYSLQQLMQVAANMPRHDGRMDFHPPLPMVQNSNAGAAMQGFNERKIKTEGVHAGNSASMFISETNYAESQNAIRETSITPFNGGESCSQSFNESMMETEMNSFGVEKITQNINSTGLTANSYNSTGWSSLFQTHTHTHARTQLRDLFNLL